MCKPLTDTHKLPQLYTAGQVLKSGGGGGLTSLSRTSPYGCPTVVCTYANQAATILHSRPRTPEGGRSQPLPSTLTKHPHPASRPSAQKGASHIYAHTDTNTQGCVLACGTQAAAVAHSRPSAVSPHTSHKRELSQRLCVALGLRAIRRPASPNRRPAGLAGTKTHQPYEYCAEPQQTPYSTRAVPQTKHTPPT